MAKRTQKAGATARFGARYGVSVRRNSASAMAKRVRNTLAPSVNIKKFPESLWEFGIAVNVTTLSLVVRGSHSQEHLTQTVELCVDLLKEQPLLIWHSLLSKLL